MKQELIKTITRYRELRDADQEADLSNREELDQRLREADHVIQALARDVTLTLRREREART